MIQILFFGFIRPIQGFYEFSMTRTLNPFQQFQLKMNSDLTNFIIEQYSDTYFDCKQAVLFAYNKQNKYEGWYEIDFILQDGTWVSKTFCLGAKTPIPLKNDRAYITRFAFDKA